MHFNHLQKERIKKEVIFVESIWGLIAQSQPSTVEADIALEFLKLLFNPYLDQSEKIHQIHDLHQAAALLNGFSS